MGMAEAGTEGRTRSASKILKRYRPSIRLVYLQRGFGDCWEDSQGTFKIIDKNDYHSALAEVNSKT